MLNPLQPLFFLLAYLVVLYLRPHEYIPSLESVPILPLFLVLSTVLWMARQPKNLSAPQFKLLPVQTFVMAWSVLLSGWPGGFVAVLADFSPAVLLFFMLATSLDTVTRMRQMFTVLSLVMLVIALHSIDQIDKGIGWTGAQLINDRVAYLGFLSDPNDLSMAFLMVLPMTVYLARKAGWLLRWLWLGTVGAILYAVVLANSRGAILSLGSMLMMFGIFRYGVKRSILVVPVLLLPIILLGPSRMSEMSASEESAEGRIESWYEGFNMLFHNPLFGVGKGQFTDYNHLTAHNSYVLALAELGLIGYGIWLSSIVLTWLMAHKVHLASPTVAVPAPDQAQGKVRAKPAMVVPGPAKSAKAPANPGTLPEIQECMRALWYGYLGGLVAMFFLSRSYVTILYVHLALIVAAYQMARACDSGVELVDFEHRRGQMFKWTLGTAFGLWFVTMVLLRIK